MKKGDFVLKNKKGLYYYIISGFEETGLVKHMFSTRIGGFSKEPFHSLNLGIKTADNINNIMKNFQKVSEVLDIPLDNIVISDQVHGTNIRIVDENDRGKGIIRQIDYNCIDGLVTNKPEVCLFTFYADCVPLFFLDKKKKVIGLAHSGWKGTVAKIGAKMVELMKNVYSSSLEDIMVGIGPSIGPCCYEVGEDVYNIFNKNFTKLDNLVIPISEDKWRINLWEANKRILEEKGILNRNIFISNLCTNCNTDLFFSYRKENGNTGRMAAVIQLI